ncbi:MAG: hypothetical protein GX088_00585 [Clostridia bacterium]|nr:hypothetical protein [Clostridia bacterium]
METTFTEEEGQAQGVEQLLAKAQVEAVAAATRSVMKVAQEARNSRGQVEVLLTAQDPALIQQARAAAAVPEEVLTALHLTVEAQVKVHHLTAVPAAIPAATAEARLLAAVQAATAEVHHPAAALAEAVHHQAAVPAEAVHHLTAEGPRLAEAPAVGVLPLAEGLPGTMAASSVVPVR